MPRILYIDDESTNLTAFRASFRKLFPVLTAKSGEEALDILESHGDIAVVVSDQRMPGMTGVELLKEVKDRFPGPKRIILTGYSDMDAIVNAINEAQAWQYLTKPWVFQDLKLVLERAVEAWTLEQENQSLESENTALLLKSVQQEKQQILSRFETLKNQINPHFLFNSLNTLSNLIHEDQLLAEEFLTKLTRVYRYVLDMRETITVALDQELEFAKHYVFLQQIRFDNALQVYWQIPDATRLKHIPPMSLQLLVENAVKHNVVSKTAPLRVELVAEDEQFIVRNNLQLRNEEIPSTKVGLQNLIERYQLLGAPTPSFLAEGDYYVARIPLIDPTTL